MKRQNLIAVWASMIAVGFAAPALANELDDPSFLDVDPPPLGLWSEGGSIFSSLFGRTDLFAAGSSCDVDCLLLDVNTGAASGNGVIAQTQNLAPGIYRLSYYLQNDDASANYFRAGVGGRGTREIPSTGGFAYQLFEDYTPVAGGSTQIAFSMSKDANFYRIDDVSLVMVDDGQGNNIAAVSQSVAFQGTYGFLDRIQNRFGRAGSPVSVALNSPVDVADNSGGYISPTGSMRAYISGYGDRGKWDDGVKSRRWGLSAGVETAATDSLDVGVTLSTGHSRFTTDTLFTNNEGRADEYLGAIHAHFSPKSVPLYLTAAAGYGYSSNDFTRASNGTDGTLVARGVEATQWLGSVEIGYDWNLGRSFTLTPYLRGDAARLDQDGYTETPLSGATLLPMTVQAVDQDAARTVLGARGTIDMAAGKRGARLTLGAGWAHEFETDRAIAFSRTSTSGTAGGVSVTFAGVAAAATPAEDSVVAGASVEAPVSDEARIYVGYNGLFASGNDSHGAEAGLRVVW